MTSPAMRRRQRLARRRRIAQEQAVEEAALKQRRWGDGQIFGPSAPVDLPPMKDVSEIVTERAEEPWPQKRLGFS